MSEQVGFDAKLYIASAPNGSYVEMTKARDIEMPVEATEIDKTTRGDQGWKARRGGLKSFSVTGELVFDSGDATWDTLRNAWLNGTQIGIKCLHGTSGQGFYGPARVTQWTRTEPLDGVITTRFTIVSDGKPTWTTSG